MITKKSTTAFAVCSFTTFEDYSAAFFSIASLPR